MVPRCFLHELERSNRSGPRNGNPPWPASSGDGRSWVACRSNWCAGSGCTRADSLLADLSWQDFLRTLRLPCGGHRDCLAFVSRELGKNISFPHEFCVSPVSCFFGAFLSLSSTPLPQHQKSPPL